MTLFTLERSAKALKDPYIHSRSGVMSFSRSGIPSPFTFANQGPAAAPEILSAHFLSVRKLYHALSLPLMEPHANLLLQPPPPTFHEIVNELLQSAANEQKVHFLRSNVPGGSGSKVTESKSEKTLHSI